MQLWFEAWNSCLAVPNLSTHCRLTKRPPFTREMAVNRFTVMHCRSYHFGGYSCILFLFFILFGFSPFSETNNVALASLHFSTNAFNIAACPAGAHGRSVHRAAVRLQTLVHGSANVPLSSLQHSQSQNALACLPATV